MNPPKNKTKVRNLGRGVTRTVTKTKDISPTGTKTKTRTVSRTTNLGLRGQLGYVGSTEVGANSGSRSFVKQKTVSKSASGNKVRSKSITGSESKQGNTYYGGEAYKHSYDGIHTATKTKSSQRGSNRLNSIEKKGSFSSKYHFDDKPLVKNTKYREAKSNAKKYGR